jgi:phosphomethylpyrimidine synthase
MHEQQLPELWQIRIYSRRYNYYALLFKEEEEYIQYNFIYIGARMTQLSEAKKGIITKDMNKVARQEGVEEEFIAAQMIRGKLVIPKNIKRDFMPQGIGEGLRTKVNANIGTSQTHYDLKEELVKLRVAVEAGAESVMDLSTGGDLDATREKIIKSSPVMIGTVPIYQAIVGLFQEDIDFKQVSSDFIFSIIEKQAQQGVDFITVHCGVTLKVLELLEKEKRVGGVVSRGGAFLINWMKANQKENPLYEYYDRLLSIAKKYDVTLSLGDGMRPGAIADATDAVQIEELIILGKLHQIALEEGVQAMIEGPGHIPLDEIEMNIKLEKRLCHGAPFYVLGPLPTDIAAGYDHITSAIGGAIAAAAGADFLCYVTPAEHLRLPTVEDVREGVIAARIAAHCGDIVKGVKGAKEKDLQMSRFRKALNWKGMFEMTLDPQRAQQMRKQSEAFEEEYCTMCGKFCAVRLHNISQTEKDQSKVIRKKE